VARVLWQDKVVNIEVIFEGVRSRWD